MLDVTDRLALLPFLRSANPLKALIPTFVDIHTMPLTSEVMVYYTVRYLKYSGWNSCLSLPQTLTYLVTHGAGCNVLSGI